MILRASKIRKLRKVRAYKKKSEELLFPLIFGTSDLEESLKLISILPTSRLFHSVITRSIISLHRNFTGTQKKILQDFYFRSGLCIQSINKIKSKSWVKKIEGIREVSSLNIRDAVWEVENLCYHKNVKVQKEAVIGLITLLGTEAFTIIEIPYLAIDDWTQSCILYNLKINEINDFKEVNLLLESKNKSLQLLGFRIVETFQLHGSYHAISGIEIQDDSSKTSHDLKVIQQRISKQIVE